MNYLVTLSILMLTSVLAYAIPDSEMVLGTIDRDEYAPEVIFPTEHVMRLEELELLQMIATHPEQQKKQIRLSPLLSMAARMKAEDMFNRNYYAHGDPDGYSATSYLPDSSRTGVTSGGEIIVPRTTLQDAFDAFYDNGPTDDNPHGQRMLFYPDEIYVGVGVATHTTKLEKEDNMFNGRVSEDSMYVVIFSDSMKFEQSYTLYAPDGTEIDYTMDWKQGVESRAGIQWTTEAVTGQRESTWFGRFTDVGGGFLLHEALGLLRTDMDAVDTTHTLSPVLQLDDWSQDYFRVIWDEFSRGVSKQGYNFYHSEYGNIWTHPQVFPYVYKRNTQSWLRVNSISREIADPLNSWITIEVPAYTTVTDLQSYETRSWNALETDAPFVEMNFDNWQVYQGDPVMLVWNTGKSSVSVTANGEQSTAPLGIMAWTAQDSAVATITDTVGNRIDRDLVVIPQPNTVQLSIHASSTSVAPGEAFVVEWHGYGDVPPQVSGTSYGVFSNDQQGSLLFSRSVPGDYEFKVRMGEHSQNVIVTVVGDLIEPPIQQTP